MLLSIIPAVPSMMLWYRISLLTPVPCYCVALLVISGTVLTSVEFMHHLGYLKQVCFFSGHLHIKESGYPIRDLASRPGVGVSNPLPGDK